MAQHGRTSVISPERSVFSATFDFSGEVTAEDGFSGEEQFSISKYATGLWSVYLILSLGLWDQGILQRVFVAVSVMFTGLVYSQVVSGKKITPLRFALWVSIFVYPIILAVDAYLVNQGGAVICQRGLWIVAQVILLESETLLCGSVIWTYVLISCLALESILIGVVEGSLHNKMIQTGLESEWTVYGTYTMLVVIAYGYAICRVYMNQDNQKADRPLDSQELSFVQVRKRASSAVASSKSESVLHLSFSNNTSPPSTMPRPEGHSNLLTVGEPDGQSLPKETTVPFQPILSLYVPVDHSNDPEQKDVLTKESTNDWHFATHALDEGSRSVLTSSRIKSPFMFLLVSLPKVESINNVVDLDSHSVSSKLQQYVRLTTQLAKLHHGKVVWVAGSECAIVFSDDSMDSYSYAFNLLGITKKYEDEFRPKIAMSTGLLLSQPVRIRRKDVPGLHVGIYPMLQKCRHMIRISCQTKHMVVCDDTVFGIIPWDVCVAIDCEFKMYGLEDDGNCTYFEINDVASERSRASEQWGVMSLKSSPLAPVGSRDFDTTANSLPTWQTMETEEIVPREESIHNANASLEAMQRRKSRQMSIKGRQDVPPEVWKLWQQADHDANGELDAEEIWSMLAALGIPMTVERYYEFLEEVDTDGNCFISLDEFMDAYNSVLSGHVLMLAVRAFANKLRDDGVDAMQHATELWKTYDKKGKGYVTLATAIQMFTDILQKPQVHSEAVQLLLTDLNPDGEDRLMLGHFVSLFAPKLTDDELALQQRIEIVTRVLYMAEKRTTVYATEIQDLESRKVEMAQSFEGIVHACLFPYVLYTVMVTPFLAALSFHPAVEESFIARKVAEIFFDAVIVVWIFSKFYLPRRNKGKMVCTQKEIRALYLWSTEMFIDLMILIPTNIIGLSAFMDDHDAREAIRVNKFALIYYLNSLYGELTKNMLPSVSRITQTMGWWVITINFLASAFIVVTRLESESHRFSVTNIHNLLSQDAFLIYATAYDWTLKLMVGLSRGSSFPSDPYLVLSLVVVLVGVSSFSLIVTTVSNALNVRDSAAMFRDFMDGTKGFMDDVGLPEDMRLELVRYYRHVFETFGSTNLTHDPLEDDLPTELMVRMKVYTTSALFNRVEVLEPLLAKPPCIYELQRISKFQVLMPGEWLCKMHEPINAFHVVMYGRLVKIPSLKYVILGETINDYGILHNMKCMESIRCAPSSFANVLTVTKIELLQVTGMFPGLMDEITSTVYRKIAALATETQATIPKKKKKSKRVSLQPYVFEPNKSAGDLADTQQGKEISENTDTAPSVKETSQNQSEFFKPQALADDEDEGIDDDDDEDDEQKKVNEFIRSHSFSSKESVNQAHRSMCERIRQSISMDDSRVLKSKP